MKKYSRCIQPHKSSAHQNCTVQSFKLIHIHHTVAAKVIEYLWTHHLFSLELLILVTSLSLLSSKLEMLSSLQSQLLLGLTFLAFKPNYNLTGSLSLLVEDGLSLSSESHLLGVITTLSLGEIGGFSGLVLGDLVYLMLTALSALAVGVTFLRYINHVDKLLWCVKDECVRYLCFVVVYLKFGCYPAA